MTKFFESKKLGVAMALLASVVALLAIAPFVPHNVQDIFRALRIGFAVGLAFFFRAYADDMKKHQPFGKDFLSRAFFITYIFFFLILIATLVIRPFLK